MRDRERAGGPGRDQAILPRHEWPCWPGLAPWLVQMAVAALVVMAGLAPSVSAEAQLRASEGRAAMTSQKYVGMWVTADGSVRHELLPNGRYDEVRGSRKSAYQGRYAITGDHIACVDDTGFTADGDFIDDVFHHGGMVLRRVQ